MKKYIVMCALLLCTVSLYSTPVFVDAYKTNFNTVDDWEMTSIRNGKTVFFKSPDSLATINVTSYFFEKPVSANGFQKIRMTGYYDGWMNLFERPGTLKESQKANVESSYVSVFSKHSLGSNMVVSEFLAGEYYFVTGNNAFVVSMSTPKDNWGNVQNELKSVLDSFWVGSGFRPYEQITIKDSYGWKHFGGSVGNTNEMLASPSIASIMQEVWAADIGAIEGLYESSYPIVVDDAVIMIVDEKIWNFNVHSGELNWSYVLQSGFSQHLATDRGIIYLVNNLTHKLMALESDTGRVVYRKKFKGIVSAPTVFNGKLYIATQKGLSILAADTGKLLNSIDLDLNVTYFPVLSNNMVLLMSIDNDIKAVDEVSGTVAWSTPLKGISYSPMSYKHYVVVANVKVNGNNSELLVLDSKSGRLLWQFDYSGRFFSLAQMPAVGDGAIVFSAQVKATSDVGVEEVKDVVMALDVSSGEPLWSQQYIAPDLGSIRPLITESLAFVSSGDKAALFCIDMVTGEKLPVRVLEESVSTQNSRLVSSRLYKKYIIKLREERDQLKLVVEL